ncbi:sensor histidine kinase [Desertivirga xinjiangensis]|uniref:sensor histidine kinase n=1 Tax=Desertivirga xinjiangensis TaxID=539206 RepID=UPI002108A0E3|nr:HAMP domain-containing sensor histidine kinase [Pedobacter xinjiangensis]
MKLLNYTSSWFALLLLIIIPVWAGVFYFTILDEIYDSMDDGLENQKILVIEKAYQDSSIVNKQTFGEGYYAFTPVDPEKALKFQDIYLDTLMYMKNEDEFEPVRMLKTAFHLNGHYYHLRLITSMVEEDDLISVLLYALAGLYIGLVCTILILNQLLIKRVWLPFYGLIDKLKHFKLNGPDTFVPPPTKIDEFILLNSTVRKLIQSNIDTYQSQKQFTENASHELQTPLAIGINKLELLAQEADLKPQQAAYIESAMNNLERMKRLNSSLLLMSKIENNQFGDRVAVNVNQTVYQLLEDLTDMVEYRQITIQTHDHMELIWELNKGLADILLSNLLKNAIFHNKPGGQITIQFSNGVLKISNNGEPRELDRNQIFERFYKGSESTSRSGLGLAIARVIAQNCRLILDYEYDAVSYTHSFTLTQ